MVRIGFAFATVLMLATIAAAQPPSTAMPYRTSAAAASQAPLPATAPAPSVPRAPWEKVDNLATAPTGQNVVGTLPSEFNDGIKNDVKNNHSGEEEEGFIGDTWNGCCNLARSWRKRPSPCGTTCGNTCEPTCGTCTGTGDAPYVGVLDPHIDRFGGRCKGYFDSVRVRHSSYTEDPCRGNLWEARGKTWGSIDVLYWKLSGDPLPPLVTTSPTNPLTPVNVAGNLPGPNDPEDNATIVFGNSLNNADWRSGLRGNLGFWLNSSHTLGFQMGGLFMESQRAYNSFTSDGSSILARPFVDASVIPNVGKAQLVGYPDTVTGQIDINDNNTFSGYDFAIRGIIAQDEWWRLDALLGYRQLRMAEQLFIQQQITAGANAPVNIGVPEGTVINTLDRFDTSNTFRGLEVGVAGETKLWRKLSLSGSAKASFGVVDQGVGIDGATIIAAPGLPINGPLVGGLLALNSNIGAYRRSDWSLVPELSFGINYQMTQRTRLKFGYDLLYLPNVQRAGGAIPKNLVIDTTRIPPQTQAPLNANPLPTFPASGNASDLFLQGIHAGLEFRF